MEADTTTPVQFEATPCPHCGESTHLVNLGTEPPRKVCGRFGCDWNGVNLLEE